MVGEVFAAAGTEGEGGIGALSVVGGGLIAGLVNALSIDAEIPDISIFPIDISGGISITGAPAEEDGPDIVLCRFLASYSADKTPPLLA